jgi:hypothetical protein
MEQFRSAAGFEAVVVHYRGIGPAINDFRAGQTMMMMPGLAAALPHIKAQKMKPIAGHRAEAPCAAAGSADDRRVGIQGIRRRTVVRHRRPGKASA